MPLSSPGSFLHAQRFITTHLSFNPASCTYWPQLRKHCILRTCLLSPFLHIQHVTQPNNIPKERQNQTSGDTQTHNLRLKRHIAPIIHNFIFWGRPCDRVQSLRKARNRHSQTRPIRTERRRGLSERLAGRSELGGLSFEAPCEQYFVSKRFSTS